MANFSDRTSSTMDLKFNQLCELYTAYLKIFRQLVHLKKIDEFGF